MDYSMLDFLVRHQLPELAQTHVYQVSDAIQPSHPLSSPFPCPQAFPVSGFFPVSQFFTSGGQSTGASASFLQLNQVKTHRNMQQMKDHGQNSPNQANEEEIGRLPEKEFRVMTVKIIQNHRNKLEEQIDK